MRAPRDHSPRLKRFARDMRRSPTEGEQRLWRLLRDRRLRGFKFRRQYPIAGFVLDFYSVKARLAVEADGGQHTGPAAVEYDARRTAELERPGMKVIRFSDVDVLKHSDAVGETILRECLGRCPPETEDPHPDPLPEYRERG